MIEFMNKATAVVRRHASPAYLSHHITSHHVETDITSPRKQTNKQRRFRFTHENGPGSSMPLRPRQQQLCITCCWWPSVYQSIFGLDNGRPSNDRVEEYVALSHNRAMLMICSYVRQRERIYAVRTNILEKCVYSKNAYILFLC